MIPQPFRQDIYSVSRLNSEIRAVLEGSFPLLWVEGEISNLSTPKSGHSYFSLKDAHAQVRCALFRGNRILLRFAPKDGDRVLVRARISFYEARGDFQLLVEHMEPAGEGALRAAFEALKAKLGQEGLFDASHKKPLPRFPRRIGVITSPTGAALHDILHVLKRRFPALPVIVYPAVVQGADAPEQLRRALGSALARNESDLIILARGGGSLEDLAAFNDEALARDIAASAIPIISAVGHETDFSISDFVADLRAPTPSAAAEIASPDREQLLGLIRQLWLRLVNSGIRQLLPKRGTLRHLQQKLALLSPFAKLRQQEQRLDELERRMSNAVARKLALHSHQQQLLASRLAAASPRRLLALHDQKLAHLSGRLGKDINLASLNRRQKLGGLAQALHALSPLATLARGYSITLLASSGKVINSVKGLNEGDAIITKLADGELESRIIFSSHAASGGGGS